MSDIENQMRVLHWQESTGQWTLMTWPEWEPIKHGLDRNKTTLSAGKHCFAVCVLDEVGNLLNLIPHLYGIGANGERLSIDDGLTDEEHAEMGRLMLKVEYVEEEQARYAELGTKLWRGSLPPPEAAAGFLKALPFMPNGDSPAAWHYLREVLGKRGAILSTHFGQA